MFRNGEMGQGKGSGPRKRVRSQIGVLGKLPWPSSWPSGRFQPQSFYGFLNPFLRRHKRGTLYFYLLSTLRRVAQLYVTLALEILMRAFCYNHFGTECRRNKKSIKKVQCPFIIAPLVRLERMGNTFLDFVETVEAVAPGVRDSLNPGSSSKTISKVEKVVGFELPEQLVSIWSLHNGQKPSTPHGTHSGQANGISSLFLLISTR